MSLLSMTNSEECLENCFCESFSDCYKDITGHRPIGTWICKQISEWHNDNYILDDDNIYRPKNGFAE